MTPSAPDKVLIIKPSALGDVITALPVLRALKRKFPDTYVSWMLSDSCASILEGDDDLDEIIPFDRKGLGKWYKSPAGVKKLWDFYAGLRKGKFDWVIDLQGLIRSGLFSWWTGAKLRAGFSDAREGAFIFYNRKTLPASQHTVDRNVELANLLELDAKGEDMTLKICDTARSAVTEKLTSLDKNILQQGYIVCSIPTRWVTKQYPVRHWRKVVEGLAEKIPVIVTGSPSEYERRMCAEVTENIPNVFNMAGKTSLKELVALIAMSRGVVCCDSAAKFIAPAVGTAGITLIGPTRTQCTGPYLSGKAIIADIPCSGCLKKRCKHITCMQSIAPGLVISETLDMINLNE